MLKEELSGGRGNRWRRVCETCGLSPSTMYCRPDAAYLCAGCYARVHGAARGHERVWVCEACERAPANFLCKADAAYLCAACDGYVHSANPLARRHHRFPIIPIVYGHPSDTAGRMVPIGENEDGFVEGDEDEAASWLLLNPVANNSSKGSPNNQNSNGYFLGGELDHYLDLVEYYSVDGDTNTNNKFNSENYSHHQNDDVNDVKPHCTAPHNTYRERDRIVPLQLGEVKNQNHQHQSFQLGLDYEMKPSLCTSSYTSTSINHSDSVSSLDVGIVPESTVSEILTPQQTWPSKGTIDLFSNKPLQVPTQLTSTDRMARVLRYREKKKTRKFEKTIRYASRKAYAETRPRVKGRFVKRSDMSFSLPSDQSGIKLRTI